MKPVTAEPAGLQEQIRSGALIAVGDQVSVFTQDHQEHKLRVTGIDAGYVSSGAVRIPIDSITGLRTREFSAGKTVSVAAGAAGLAAVGAFLAALAAVGYI